MGNNPLSLNDIQAALARESARWQASTTPLAQLPLEEQ